MDISKNELKNVKAGAIHWGVVALVGGIVSFVVGILDGITNPYKCRK